MPPETPPPVRKKIIPVIPRTRGELARMRQDDPPPGDAAVLERAVRAGARWFYWIGALSLLNSIIRVSGGHLSFLAGLAVVQLLDAIGAHAGIIGPYFSIGSGLVAAFFVCAVGYFAAERSRAAYLVGMIFYALDGGIFLGFGIISSALFHGFALIFIWQGFAALRKLRALRAWQSRQTIVESRADPTEAPATPPGPAARTG